MGFMLVKIGGNKSKAPSIDSGLLDTKRCRRWMIVGRESRDKDACRQLFSELHTNLEKSNLHIVFLEQIHLCHPERSEGPHTRRSNHKP